MQITAPSAYDPGGPVRLDPRPFHGVRDGVVAGAFVVAVVGCTAAAITWGHAAAVLGAVYSAMAFVVWVEAFRSTWAVGPEAISSRRWAVWRTLREDDVTTVDIDPGEPGIDLSISGHGLSRIVVPLDDWRRRAGAVDRLAEFVANAERRGATVGPGVWAALARS